VLAGAFVGCDLLFGPEDSNSSRPSDIPIPDSSNYLFPDITNAVEASRVLQENLTTFSPWLSEEPTVEPLNPVSSGLSFFPQPVKLIENGNLVDPISVRFKYETVIKTYYSSVTYNNPLKSSPVHLAKKIRHRKIFQHQMSYPATYSETHTVTAGTESTQAQTFAETTGWDTSATVGATNGFISAEVTASYSEEVSQTFEESITLSTYETKEQTFATAPDEGEDLLYAAWNRELVFQYVGTDGTPWQAPGYSFETPIQFTNQTGKDLVTTNDRFFRD